MSGRASRAAHPWGRRHLPGLATTVLGIAAVAVAVGSASSVSARPTYYQAWDARYPGSRSDSNIANGMGQVCFLCHATSDAPPGGFGGSTPPPPAASYLHFSWNPYGWSLRRLVRSGLGIEDALAAVEQLDADADPTGSTNLEEILSDAQPGWTDGPHNTVYLPGGVILEDVKPPKDALGDLNPPGRSYCTSTPNSTGFPAVMSSSGASVVAENVFSLHASPVPDEVGIFYYGPSRAQTPFGPGTLCVGGRLFRLPPRRASGQVLSHSLDLASQQGEGKILVGSTWHFQAWFLDRAAGWPGFNTSDGLSVTFR